MQARTLTGMWGHWSEGRPPSSCSRLLPTSPQSSSSHRQCRNKRGEATALRFLYLHWEVEPCWGFWNCIRVLLCFESFCIFDMQVILEEARTQRRPKSAPQPQSRKMASVEERLKVDYLIFVCCWHMFASATQGSPFLKCSVSIWELPVRGGVVKACQDGFCTSFWHCPLETTHFKKGLH